MPKVTMYYRPDGCAHTEEKLLKIGRAVQIMVANAASIGPAKLDPVADVDFIPMPYPDGTLTVSPVAFEIETFGYPERKKKLTEEAVKMLKSDLVLLLGANFTDFATLSPKHGLVWIKYVDPDGHHV